MNLPSAISPLPAEFDEATLRRLTGSLSAAQLAWLSGYLYAQATLVPGAASGAPLVAGAPVPVAAPAAGKLAILYGSHTGNGKKVAQQAAEAARQRGFEVQAQDLNDYQPRQLAQEENLLLIVSTHGEGEPPVAAEDFYNFVRGPRAPKLPKLRFAVLALGDRSYLHFCQTGRDLDQQLAELGGTRLLDRVECDVAYQAPAAAWITAALDQLTPAPTAGTAPAAATLGPPPTPAITYSAENPWPARVLESIQLNGRGSTKETYHLEFDLAGSGLHYAPGDALGVLAVNHTGLVEQVLTAARLGDTTPVEVAGDTMPLAAVLTHHRELTVLTRDVLERYAAHAPHPDLHTLLADPARLKPYLYGRDVADLLQDFPTDTLTPQLLADTLRPLPGRAYSIASSLLAHPDEVHLTVGALRYEAHGRRKHGVCSVYLADQVAVGDEARVFVQPNEYFRLPADTGTDIIMVGAGTGVAPFRAFVEERAELGALGRNWLLFGNPHFTTDFLYQTEWQQHLKKGKLARLDVAFSRDQAQKVYVQDKLLAHGREVFEWLEKGAHFYVCGDKDRLGAAVQTALTAVVQQAGGLGAEAAADYVRQLRKQRRYLEDVY